MRQLSASPKGILTGVAPKLVHDHQFVDHKLLAIQACYAALLSDAARRWLANGRLIIDGNEASMPRHGISEPARYGCALRARSNALNAQGHTQVTEGRAHQNFSSSFNG